MSARLIVGIAAWVSAVACALYSGFLTWDAVDKVNELLPAEKRFNPLWWHTDKHWWLRHEYRRLYPGGKLIRNAFLFEIACFTCFGIGIWALHVFGRYLTSP